MSQPTLIAINRAPDSSSPSNDDHIVGSPQASISKNYETMLEQLRTALNQEQMIAHQLRTEMFLYQLLFQKEHFRTMNQAEKLKNLEKELIDHKGAGYLHELFDDKDDLDGTGGGDDERIISGINEDELWKFAEENKLLVGDKKKRKGKFKSLLRRKASEGEKTESSIPQSSGLGAKLEGFSKKKFVPGANRSTPHTYGTLAQTPTNFSHTNAPPTAASAPAPKIEMRRRKTATGGEVSLVQNIGNEIAHDVKKGPDLDPSPPDSPKGLTRINSQSPDRGVIGDREAKDPKFRGRAPPEMVSQNSLPTLFTSPPTRETSPPSSVKDSNRSQSPVIGKERTEIVRDKPGGVLSETDSLFQDYQKLVIRMRDPKTGLDLRNRKINGKTFYACFKAQDALQWMKQRLQLSPSEALNRCQQLMEDEVFRFVNSHPPNPTDAVKFSENSKYVYQLAEKYCSSSDQASEAIEPPEGLTSPPTSPRPRQTPAAQETSLSSSAAQLSNALSNASATAFTLTPSPTPAMGITPTVTPVSTPSASPNTTPFRRIASPASTVGTSSPLGEPKKKKPSLLTKKTELKSAIPELFNAASPVAPSPTPVVHSPLTSNVTTAPLTPLILLKPTTLKHIITHKTILQDLMRSFQQEQLRKRRLPSSYSLFLRQQKQTDEDEFTPPPFQRRLSRSFSVILDKDKRPTEGVSMSKASATIEEVVEEGVTDLGGGIKTPRNFSTELVDLGKNQSRFGLTVQAYDLRSKEKIRTVKRLQKTFLWMDQATPIVAPQRELIKEGTFRKKKTTTDLSGNTISIIVEYHLYLFNDLLIVGRPAFGDLSLLLFKAVIPLESCIVWDVPADGKCKFGFQVVRTDVKSQTLMFNADTREIKEAWIKAICKCTLTLSFVENDLLFN